MIYLVIFFVLLLLHYLYFLTKISLGLRKSSQNNFDGITEEFISVIIPFRNEEDNILNSINSIKSQTFPISMFEVIYIDDYSDDNSRLIIENSEIPYNIRILQSPFGAEERAHKKKALQYAIGKAKGEIIITTDSDCTHNKNWLSEMIKSFDKNTAFVSGPVYFESKNNLFEKIQQLEFSSLILVGAGLIGNNFPIICNAANLGFRKSVYEKVGGYEDNINISSGDDEFLMQKISRMTDYKIKFCHSRDAISYTSPNKTINDFYQQRKRWASKGFHYVNKKITIILIFIFLFYLSIPTQLILGIFFNKIFYLMALVSVLLKVFFEYKIVIVDSKTLFPKSKFLHFIVAAMIHIPYILISGISGIFGNYRWKGRKIKR